jgi:hypothetical protein
MLGDLFGAEDEQLQDVKAFETQKSTFYKSKLSLISSCLQPNHFIVQQIWTCRQWKDNLATWLGF